MDAYEPRYTLAETASGVRLTLVGLASGDGETLQEAADDLVRRLLEYATGVREGSVRTVRMLIPVDVRALNFLCRLGAAAERGEDVRAPLFD